MCTDNTMQEIAFLVSLLSFKAKRSQHEIARDLENTIKNLGWPPYLEFAPSNIVEIMDRAKYLKYIHKTSPFTWSITNVGKDRLTYLIDRFVPEDEREALREAAGIYA